MHQPERRKSVRRKQLKSAIIAFNNRHSTMPANMRDISDGGARLEAPGNMVPDTFELLVEMDGLEVPCRVVWRRTNEIGVAFTGPLVKKAPRRAQVIEAVQEHASAPSLRKKRSSAPLAEVQAVEVASAPLPLQSVATAEPAAEPTKIAEPVKKEPIFPAAARFAINQILGMPEATEQRLRATIGAELEALDRAAADLAKAPFALHGALTAVKVGSNLKYIYVFDVISRGGRPMHRIIGELQAYATRGQSLWAALESHTTGNIAAAVISDLVSRIAD